MFFSALHFSCFAQTNIHSDKFFTLFYSFEIENAYKTINVDDGSMSEIQKNLLKSYFSSNIINFDNNTEFVDSAKFFSQKATNLILEKKNLSNDEYFNIISAQAVVLKVDFKQGNYFAAFVNFLKYDKYIDYILENQEKNSYFKLSSGLYYYYMYLAEKDYPLLYPLLYFYPRGDSQKGLKYLSQCANDQNVFISTESKYYLARIYCRDEKNFVMSSKYFLELLKKYPENIFWQYEYALCLKKYGKTDEYNSKVNYILREIQGNNQLTNSQKLFFEKNLSKPTAN